MDQELHGTEEYVPGVWFFVIIGVAYVGLIALGFYVSSLYEWEQIEGGAIWFWLAGMLVSALVGPVVVQYVLLRRFGKHPRWKWGNWNRSQLVSWWRPDDKNFTKIQFVSAYATPGLLICLVAAVYVIRFPTAAPVFGFVVPAYFPNFWYALLALSKL